MVAVDVGTGQLVDRLRHDRRVEVREQTDIRALGDTACASFELIVADLSFISLAKVLPALGGLADPEATIVVLVKPQFEAGRHAVAAGGGVIDDPATWRRVLRDVVTAAAAERLVPFGLVPSPITGSAGNVEFLLGLRPAGASSAVDATGIEHRPGARSGGSTLAGQEKLPSGPGGVVSGIADEATAGRRVSPEGAIGVWAMIDDAVARAGTRSV